MAGKREEQIKEIMERLEQGVQELFTSEKYTEYLKTMSRFHNYSFNNTLLIAAQKPGATLVAGYGAWQKKFNRQVKRGEKGIKIIAPAPIRHKEEIEKVDPETNKPVLRPDGQPETEEVERVIPRFRVATVFDVSQTYGDPLPELDAPELMGSVENFPVFMEAIEKVSPVPMRYDEIEGDAKGYYSNVDKEIVLREGMSEKQTMKTAVHEVTHAMCHDRDLLEELGEKKNQTTKEVEAESVAYAVCGYFDLDTSDYSFPYIAGWSSSMEMKELRTSMDFIRKTAGSFIDSMTENIQKLRKEKEEKREIGEDDLVFQVSLSGEDAKKFYLVDNVGRADFLRLLETFAEQRGETRSPERFLREHGAHLDLWKDSKNPERNDNMPNFYDVLYIDAENIIDASKFSTLVQVELMISRAEYGHTTLGKEEHTLAVRHAYKLDNLRETQNLIVDMINAVENPEIQDIQEIMDEAQAEIDALPDNKIGLTQMHDFGYRNDSILPLTMERAVTLHHAGLHIYNLHEDGSSVLMNTEEDILEAGAMFGVEARAWESYQVMESVREEKEGRKTRAETTPESDISQERDEGEMSEELLYTDTADRYAVFQIDEDGKGREYLFCNMDFIQKRGMEVEGGDYSLIYGGRLGRQDNLDTIYEKFNINHPEGYTGHSLSVSDIVVLNRGGRVSAHFVDRFGFAELPDFVSQRQQLIGIEAARDLEEEAEARINEDTRGFTADGHFGAWHTAETREMNGERFYRMEHDEYGDSVASIIVNQDGKLVAEDLEHGFDQGAMDAISEYFAEKGTTNEQGTPGKIVPLKSQEETEVLDVPEKVVETLPKPDKDMSGGGSKRSVLNALRERQTRLKAREREKQEQKPQAHRKGEQEL